MLPKKYNYNKMNLKRYSQLFEADIKKNKGIPEDYIEGVERKGRERFGYTGPNHMEMREMMDALRDIMRIQHGNEDKLSEIGKEIILNEYGNILEDVKLDIKIVKPNDEEKGEMVQKMLSDDEDEEEQDEGGEEIEINLPEPEVDVNEVDKRKILNNLMQGEAQNVHSLMHFAKDQIDEIDDNLLHYYTRLLEINRKFDWLDSANLEQMMKQNPDMCSAEEVDWEEDEEGNSTPVIKVRALDLPMLIHETVKGIYELIMAHAIPDNEYLAKRIMAETDTLTDEKQDIKFGPFIAADIRDFFTNHVKRTTGKDIQDIEHLREFIYARLVTIEAEKFVELIHAILSDEEKADKLLKEINIIEDSIADATGEEETVDIPYDADEEDLMTGEREGERNVGEDDEMLKPKDRSYADMSKRELDDILNQALDNGDFETIKKIQEYL